LKRLKNKNLPSKGTTIIENTTALCLNTKKARAEIGAGF
jgi:hypothetical protein